MSDGYVIDTDTTDDFLDLPVSTYGPDGKTLAEIRAEREAAGLPPLSDTPMKLPPLTDH